MDPMTQLIIQGVALALVLLVIKLWFNGVGRRIDSVEATLKADIKDVKDRLQAHEDKCAERDRKVAGTIGGLVTAVTKTIPPLES